MTWQQGMESWVSRHRGSQPTGAKWSKEKGVLYSVRSVVTAWLFRAFQTRTGGFVWIRPTATGTLTEQSFKHCKRSRWKVRVSVTFLLHDSQSLRHRQWEAPAGVICTFPTQRCFSESKCQLQFCIQIHGLCRRRRGDGELTVFPNNICAVETGLGSSSTYHPAEWVAFQKKGQEQCPHFFEGHCWKSSE